MRALAVLLVILCHGQVLAVGWVGVQLFFVLSGFLITRILLQDQQSSHSFGQYLGRFYARRALRIFPLYYAYLTLLALGVALSPALSPVAERLLPSFTYTTNFWALLGHNDPVRYTDHLWSLAVEEQFYLAWPLILALVPAARRPSLVLAVILAGPLLRGAFYAGAPLLSGVFPLLERCTPCAVYLMPTSHLDAFAWGAALNFIRFRPQAWQLAVVVAILLLSGILANGADLSLRLIDTPRLVLGWPLFLPRGLQSVWGYSLLNLASFLTIALILQRGALRRLFSHPLLDYVGKRSYGMYVFHFPVLQLLLPLLAGLQAATGQTVGTALFQLPLILVTLGAASLSFRYLEQPMLRLRHHFRGADALPARAALAQGHAA